MQPLVKRLGIWGGIIAALLMIPLIAMQFTPEVNWALTDFLIMGAILVVIASAYELIAKRSSSTMYRSAFAVGLLGAFLLFWVNGAVGIIGSEDQPANMLFASVFVVGLVGAFVARFKPRGMSRTLYAAAIVTMIVPIIALIIWPPPATSWAPGIFGVFLMSAFFAMLFVLSGNLFMRTDVS